MRECRRAQFCQRRAIRMTLGGKNRRDKKRIGIAAEKSTRAMRRSGDQPMGITRAPMTGFRGAGFGQMQAIGLCRQFFVIGHDQKQISRFRDRQQCLDQLRAVVAGTGDNQAAKGQFSRGGNGIGQPVLVGEKRQNRQGQIMDQAQPYGCPCQASALKAIAHLMSQLADNLAAIIARIEAARKSAIAPAPSTSLVAVSKTHEAQTVEKAIAAGQKIFGENRVQEAQGKFPALKAAHPDLQLHLIGPLQSNKVKEAVALFDCIETLDRPKLAEALAAEMKKSGKAPMLFIQVNTGEEPQKAGILPAEASGFIRTARDEFGLPVRGLMCIPPVTDDAAPHFAFLAKLAKENALEFLSMGMSGDFETAIKFGATHVRVGTAIFGERSASDPD